jgi:hypothetical protein
MNTSINVVSFSQEDTGIEGHIQIYTQFNNNYFVKYFEYLTDYDKYLKVSLNDFTIVENHLIISEHRKKMILFYIMKNSKPIHTYYYHGLTMECSDTLELFEQFRTV